MKTKAYDVFRVDWLESESGWGQRPDGYSIHLTLEDYNQFMKDYWAKMPDAVPQEYSRPCSIPVHTHVDLTKEEYKKLVTNMGLRYS